MVHVYEPTKSRPCWIVRLFDRFSLFRVLVMEKFVYGIFLPRRRCSECRLILVSSVDSYAIIREPLSILAVMIKQLSDID